jgi:UDP-glucuronate 4-epimerase
MALFKFTKAMLAGESIDVYNHGEMYRDFTYIDDIAEAVLRLQAIIPQPNPDWSVEQGSPASSSAPYHVYNIGNSNPVKLMEYIHALEGVLGITARKNMLPMQPGDVMDTSADTDELYHAIGFKPEIGVEEGVRRFVEWYKAFYHVE